MGNFIPFPLSEDTTNTFITHIFRLHRLPYEILSNSNTQFSSKFWTFICKTLKISMKLSSPFHHQTNDLKERVSSVVEQFLRCYSNFKGSNWQN